MISHPILPSYNLKAEFLVDIPEENPAPEDVKRIMDTVQSTNLKTILNEPQAGEDAFAALARISTCGSACLIRAKLAELKPCSQITISRSCART